MLKRYQSPNKIPSSRVRPIAGVSGASPASALSGTEVALTTKSFSDFLPENFNDDGRGINPSIPDDLRLKLKLEFPLSTQLLTTVKRRELE